MSVSGMNIQTINGQHQKYHSFFVMEVDTVDSVFGRLIFQHASNGPISGQIF
jgi:hypothetical protein